VGSDAHLELSVEEKLVLNLLNEKSPINLNELKGKTGLSNKKWDTVIKGLRKHELVKVEKTDPTFAEAKADGGGIVCFSKIKKFLK
jgi:predicted transcriptional regulator